MSKRIAILALCVVIGIILGNILAEVTRVQCPPYRPEQLQLPMPLDDGTRSEVAVYSIETEVE